MWPRWSHMLAPLTKLTSIKQRFKWTQVKQDGFEELKLIVEHGTLITYPDFNETLKSIPMLARSNYERYKPERQTYHFLQ